MRPHGFDETEQLRYAKAHAAMLREEWRRANWSAPRGAEEAPGALRSAKMRAGRAMIGLGRRLLSQEGGTRRVALTAGRPDWGCE
jgi:hypothetical protein